MVQDYGNELKRSFGNPCQWGSDDHAFRNYNPDTGDWGMSDRAKKIAAMKPDEALREIEKTRGSLPSSYVGE